MRAPRALCSLALALALVGTAAACGDDGDDGEGGGEVELTSAEQEYADAWASVLADDEEGFAVSAEDADCMAAAMMAEIGAEPFEEREVEPADIQAEEGSESDSPGEVLGAGVISDEQADAVLDRWEGCTDVAAALADAALVEFDLDEEGRDCVADGLREDDLAREGLKPSFTSDNDEPPAGVLSALVDLVDRCAGAEGTGEGGVIVQGIAESLQADGSLTEEQATCLAQAMVDTIGLERLIEFGASGGDLSTADPEVQQEVTRAILDASERCGVPLSELGQ